MRKKAEPRTPQHPKPSRAGAGKEGLIVPGKTERQSDRESCALDNRSHRTPRIRRRGRLHRTRLSPENMARPRSPASAR
jgi:hypothetical protein